MIGTREGEKEKGERGGGKGKRKMEGGRRKVERRLRKGGGVRLLCQRCA